MQMWVKRACKSTVSGSMALVAMFLYMGIFVYMHRRKPVLAEAT